jgi:hypothetical protein
LFISPMSNTHTPLISSFWSDLTSNIWWRVQTTVPITHVSAISCYFFPLQLKYFPQHYVFRHPESTRDLRFSRRWEVWLRSFGLNWVKAHFNTEDGDSTLLRNVGFY